MTDPKILKIKRVKVLIDTIHYLVMMNKPYQTKDLYKKFNDILTTKGLDTCSIDTLENYLALLDKHNIIKRKSIKIGKYGTYIKIKLQHVPYIAKTMLLEKIDIEKQETCEEKQRYIKSFWDSVEL